MFDNVISKVRQKASMASDFINSKQTSIKRKNFFLLAQGIMEPSNVLLSERDTKEIDYIDRYLCSDPVDKQKQALSNGDINMDEFINLLVNNIDNPLAEVSESNIIIAIKKHLDLSKEANLSGKEGYTLLMWAIDHKFDNLVKLLLDNNASCKRVDSKGNNALHHVVANASDTTILKLILARLGLVSDSDNTFLKVKNFFFKHRLEEKNNKGETPLILATKNIFSSETTIIVEHLLQQGADPKNTNLDGEDTISLLKDTKQHIDQIVSKLSGLLEKVESISRGQLYSALLSETEITILSQALKRQNLDKKKYEDYHDLISAMGSNLEIIEKLDKLIENIEQPNLGITN